MQTYVKHLGYKSHRGGKNAKGLKAIKDHLKYIENRKNELGEREERELFTKNGNISRNEFYESLKEQPQKGVIAHKLVISMDRKDYELQKIDLKELTKDTLAGWEAKTGKQLNWVACIHSKESNPHVHILIGGRDLLGKEISIMQHDLKNIKKIADKERGLQSERNIGRSMEHERDFDPLKQIEKEREIEGSDKKVSPLKGLIPEKDKMRDRSLEMDFFSR